MEHRLTLRWDKINGDYSKQDILNTKDRGIKANYLTFLREWMKEET